MLTMPQNLDCHLFGSSTAPRGVRILSVIFSLLSIAALAIFIISLWRNIDGPPIGIKILRLGLPIVVLAGAYMIRRLWIVGLWIFGGGVVLWVILLSRSLLVVSQSTQSFIVVGVLWCFSLGTIIYLIMVRKAFMIQTFSHSTTALVSPSLSPIVPVEVYPAPLATPLPDSVQKEETNTNLPHTQ